MINKIKTKRPKTKESVGIAFPYDMLAAIDRDKPEELTRSQFVVKLLRKKYPLPATTATTG